MKFSQDLQETMKYLNNELHTDRNFDVVYRVLTIGGKNACLYFIDGFTKDDRYFYFPIQKDGETVIVENEKRLPHPAAGRGYDRHSESTETENRRQPVGVP